MKYTEIMHMAKVNGTDASKVAGLVESIKANGWNGAPILVCSDYGLVTGSHRLAALDAICNEWMDTDDARLDAILESDIAEDVTDEVEAYCEREGVTFDQLPFDALAEVFEGTWVAEYADGIEEW